MAKRKPIDRDAIARATPAAMHVYARWYFFDGQNVINNQSNWHIFHGVDPYSFEVLGKPKGRGVDSYARDRTHVFYSRDQLVGADAETFELVGDRGYARDRTRWYFLGQPVAPRGAIERVSGLLATIDANALLAGKPCDIDDPPTLRPVALKLGVYRDRATAYVIHEPDCWASYHHARLLRFAADVTSLAIASGRFLADSARVFSIHTDGAVVTLAGLDPQTTRFHGDFAIGDLVYYRDRQISGADPPTFVVHAGPGYYAQDRERAYYEDAAVPVVDIGSFAVFPASCYARDARGVMFGATRIDADPATFVVLDALEARDATTLYHRDERLRPARASDQVRPRYTAAVAAWSAARNATAV